MARREQAEELDGVVTLGDGKIAIRDDFGVGFLVSGSRMVDREPTGWTQAKEDGLYNRAWASPQTFVPPPGMKFCSACGDWRPTAYFDRDATRRDGYSYACKACSHPEAAARMRRKRREQAAAEGRDVRRYVWRTDKAKAAGE